VTDGGGHAPAPISDLFASAVHRYGKVWADLAVAAVVAGAAATAVVVAADFVWGAGGLIVTALLAYPMAYFEFLGWVMLRGLPAPPPRRRVGAAAVAAAGTGVLAGVLVYVLGPFAAVVAPLLLFAVPAVAAGDVRPVAAVPRAASLAVRNFTRTWAVWAIALVFCAPIGISMFLVVSAFAGAGASILLGAALAVPIAWPFSALFVRALYGDLTGRSVVAPQDRTR